MNDILVLLECLEDLRRLQAIFVSKQWFFGIRESRFLEILSDLKVKGHIIPRRMSHGREMKVVRTINLRGYMRKFLCSALELHAA